MTLTAKQQAWFWARVNKAGRLGCWLWTGKIGHNGYGKSSARLAHRVSWELQRGPIPAGLVIDHLCRVRHCVNPDHLEPVTIQENIRRGIGQSAVNTRKTHCIRGHALEGENLLIKAGKRQCRDCTRAAGREDGKRHYRKLPHDCPICGKTFGGLVAHLRKRHNTKWSSVKHLIKTQEPTP